MGAAGGVADLDVDRGVRAAEFLRRGGVGERLGGVPGDAADRDADVRVQHGVDPGGVGADGQGDLAGGGVGLPDRGAGVERGEPDDVAAAVGAGVRGGASGGGGSGFICMDRSCEYSFIKGELKSGYDNIPDFYTGNEIKGNYGNGLGWKKRTRV